VGTGILSAMPDPSSVARRNSWPLVITQSVSQLGDYLALFFALPVFVRDATGSAAQLGLLSMFETAAVLLFGFFAGVLVDRIRVRRALITADLVRAAGFALLAFAVASGAGTVWMAFGVAFLVGSMATVFDTGLESYVPSVLTDDMLVVVNSRLQVGRNLAQTLGFVAGGIVLAWGGGVAAAFAFDAATYLVSVIGILMLREVRPRPRAAYEPVWPALMTGLRTLWASLPLRWATASAFFINLAFAPLAAVMTLYAQQDLGIDSDLELGLFFAGFSALGALGVAMAPRLITVVGLGRAVIAGGILFGAGATAAGVSRGLGTVVPFGLAIAGVSISQVAFVTLRQRLSPPERLGRVIAASRTISFAGIPVGAVFGGIAGDAIGLRPLFVGGGLMIAAAACLLIAGPLWTLRADRSEYDTAIDEAAPGASDPRDRRP
jgi:predicted MFS family arabinose efflux permease